MQYLVCLKFNIRLCIVPAFAKLQRIYILGLLPFMVLLLEESNIYRICISYIYQIYVICMYKSRLNISIFRCRILLTKSKLVNSVFSPLINFVLVKLTWYYNFFLERMVKKQRN